MAREGRKVLFDNANTSTSRKKKLGSGASSTASEAQSIQQSLQRTQNLLKNELHRVSQVASAIDEDGKLLEDTKATHQSLNVRGAAQALTSLQRAQQREQRVLMASVTFFLAVVVYIMWCRILVKLPLVERILKLVVGKLHNVMGESFVQAQAAIGIANVRVQELFLAGKDQAQDVLSVGKDQAEVMMRAIQDLIGGKP